MTSKFLKWWECHSLNSGFLSSLTDEELAFHKRTAHNAWMVACGERDFPSDYFIEMVKKKTSKGAE